jgi:Transglycosylase-like domain
MHVRKRTGPYERRHTAAPTLAGSASRTTTGQEVVSGGKVRRSLGVAGRRGMSVRVVAGIGAALVAVAVVGSLAMRSSDAQAAVSPANSVTAFGAAPTVAPPIVAPVASYVGIAPTVSGRGYWVAAEDGGVFAFGDANFYGSAGGQALNQPIVGIAATPSGLGYWLVGRDGGVFAFGDANFYGSAGGETLNQPIVGIAASADGHGYWLVARDGGVFAFGDAPFLGSVARLDLGAAVVGIAATPSHEGYWLVGADGGVFSFGDATFSGSESGRGVHDAIGIAPGRTGYWIARSAGAVAGFGTGNDELGAAALTAPDAATTGIAGQADGGFWTVQGSRAATTAAVDHMNPFLVCTRSHESSHTPPAYDTGYGAVNPSGTYRGAYQFSRSTWNNAAMRAGRLDLVGIDPAAASVADQDLLALDLYHWQGAGPWMGRCAGL